MNRSSHISCAAPGLFRSLCLAAGRVLRGAGLVCSGMLGFGMSVAMAEVVEVPSGQPITLQERLVVPPENRILYLGFLAPALGGDYGVSFERASTDMDVICESVGIREAGRLIGQGVRIDEVVVRLMERAIPYGEVDPDAAQFLNAYDISGGNCVWM